MTEDKTKVKDLATELGVPTKNLLQALRELDIPAKRLLWFAAPWLVLLVFIIWFIADVTYRKMKGKTGRSDEPKCSEPSPEKESES